MDNHSWRGTSVWDLVKLYNFYPEDLLLFIFCAFRWENENGFKEMRGPLWKNNDFSATKISLDLKNQSFCDYQNSHFWDSTFAKIGFTKNLSGGKIIESPKIGSKIETNFKISETIKECAIALKTVLGPFSPVKGP